MIVKNIIDEDVSNYQRISMFIGFPHCSFKCEKECGQKMCQNSILAKAPDIEVPCEDIVNRYMENPITSAVVCGGLEPFDDFDDLLLLVKLLRERTDDDIVIYTGYCVDEILNQISQLKKYPNIVIKFGRYVPGKKSHYDDVLGVTLASDNQCAGRIS